jgi:sulfite exporter TauE/SafE
VPELARRYADPATSQTTREATAIVFQSFHRYLGIGIGECLGYLLTGGWTTLVGVAMLQSSAFRAWLAWPGIVIGVFLIVGSLEFDGRFDVPIAYIAWSLWLILSGLTIFGRGGLHS